MTDRPTLRTRVLEGVTIVLSILIAFANDSWWDSLASRALHEGLTAVVEELEIFRMKVALTAAELLQIANSRTGFVR